MKLSRSFPRFGALPALCALSGLTAISALPSGALAAEVVWDGHYRSSGYYFNSLSLVSEDDSAYSEGAASWMDHRLRLQPGFLLSNRVAIYTQVDLLPYVRYGEEPVSVIDPVSGEALPYVYSDAVGAPTTSDGAVTGQNIQVTRAWGEVQTKYGQLRFGRMPVEWGAGMVWNAGNGIDADYGDTADRLQFTGKAGPVYVMGGLENRYEGLVAEPDDYRALVGAVYYKGEKVGAGTYQTYRRRSITDDAGVESKYTTWIGDIWAGAKLGPAQLDLELAGVVGGGDLDEGINDLKVSAFGGVLTGAYRPGKLRAGGTLGFATGDALDDGAAHTFSFDPDFDVGIMLFEEPMPSLQPEVTNESNLGRTTEIARATNTVSNAIFIKPSVGYQLHETLTADLSILAAQQAKATDGTGKGYGTEIDATLGWDPYAHFHVGLIGGVFLPGKHFTEYSSDDFGEGFKNPVLGSKLTAAVQF